MHNSTTQMLLADWRLQRAHLDREIAFQEGDLHGADSKVLDELRGLAAELDRLIAACRADKAETRH